MSSVRFRHPAQEICWKVHHLTCLESYHLWVALTDRDYAILDFERSAWKSNDTKQKAIRKTFSISPTRYYQLRDALIDKPEAVNFDPMVVKRLQRARKLRRSKKLGISISNNPIR